MSKGCGLNVFVSVPLMYDPKNVFITAWIKPVTNYGKTLVGQEPVAVKILAKAKEEAAAEAAKAGGTTGTAARATARATASAIAGVTAVAAAMAAAITAKEKANSKKTSSSSSSSSSSNNLEIGNATATCSTVVKLLPMKTWKYDLCVCRKRDKPECKYEFSE